MDVMADMMNVNVIGVAMACKHFGKVMKENGYGRIINLSSVRASGPSAAAAATWATVPPRAPWIC